MPDQTTLPGTWRPYGQPTEDIHAPNDPRPRRMALLRSDEMGGIVALFAAAGQEFAVDLDPGATYRVTIERVDDHARR